MNYFKILGILFGTIAFLKPVYMHLLPWDENSFLEKTYVERRPAWIVPVAIAAFFLVGFTWYKHIVSNIPYSMILAILFTFIAIKSIIFIFNYEKFQVWVAKMLRKDKGKDVLLIDIGVGIFGLVILLLAIFIY